MIAYGISAIARHLLMYIAALALSDVESAFWLLRLGSFHA